MSALRDETPVARRRGAAERALASARSRRAGSGTVTEMARVLLREARESDRRRALCASALAPASDGREQLARAA